jgi:hypothetical protein
MYVITNSKHVVVSPQKFSDRKQAETSAAELAKYLGIATAVQEVKERVFVRKTMMAKADHSVYVALGKKRADKTRKVLRIGQKAEIEQYCKSFVRKSGYSPTIRLAPDHVVVGSRI